MEEDKKSKTKSHESKNVRHLSLGRWDRQLNENLHLNHIDPFHAYNSTSNAEAPNSKASSTSCDFKHSESHKTTPKSNRNKNALKDYNKCGDRFIANRTSTNVELGHYQLFNKKSEDDDVFESPKTQIFKKTITDNLHGELENQKIIGYKQKMPDTMLNADYVKVKASSTLKKNTLRHIPTAPEKILDAPEISDDYYLNLLDWSSKNVLAICLGSSVYMWDANSGQITSQADLTSEQFRTTAVSWVDSGNLLAMGTSSNTIHLYDVDNNKTLRTLSTHAAKVGALGWNEYILTSADQAGIVQHHDVRVQKHLVGRFQAHAQEVCGLKWSSDGKLLATGGNDNTIRVYPDHRGMHYTRSTPLYQFTEHNSAVKALAWCPWQPYLLASGGGQNDKQIAFWNCNTGKLTGKTKTNSQVTCLLWSEEYHEIASSHGYDRFQVTLWKYPVMHQVAELTGHDARIIDMAMSPDGTLVMTAGADETLRLWNCFEKDLTSKKKKEAIEKEGLSSMCRAGKIR